MVNMMSPLLRPAKYRNTEEVKTNENVYQCLSVKRTYVYNYVLGS